MTRTSSFSSSISSFKGTESFSSPTLKIEEERCEWQEKMEVLTSENSKLREDNDRLRGYLKLMRNKMFAPRSEKLTSTSEMPQLPGLEVVFDESHIKTEESYDSGVLCEDGEETAQPVEGKKKKKTGRKALPRDLPRELVIHDLPAPERVCSCGHTLHKIGEEATEQLDYIPARLKVIRHVRYKYGCKGCEETVKLAPLPPQPLPKSIASAGLLSHILVSKYQDHLPLDRQEQMFERLDIDLKKGTMSTWILKIGALVEPVVECLRQEIVTDDYVRADETTVQVLREPGRTAQSSSYMWTYMTGSKPLTAIVYDYQPTRAQEHPKAFLKGFRGRLQTDAYPGYNGVTHQNDVTAVGCWAHCRRKFSDVVTMTTKKPGKALEALRIIGKLYEIERFCKEQDFPPEEIKALRQEKSKPILEAFKKWIDKEVALTLPKSPLGQAFRYAARQWETLTVYLEDGRLDIDNNACERAIRPFAVGRKNWLFMGNVQGAKASANIYSLIETCKANNIDPSVYLKVLLEKISSTDPEKMTDLLPWNCLPPP